MVKKIELETFLGLVLATLVTTIAPVGEFVGKYFNSGFGYLFSLIFDNKTLAIYMVLISILSLLFSYLFSII